MADDLDNLSEAEIDALYNKTVGVQSKLDDLDNMSEAEIDALYSNTIKSEPPPSRKIEAGIEGFGTAATLGYLPQIQAGVEKGVDYLSSFIPGTSANTDKQLREQGFQVESPSYIQMRDENLRRQQELQQQNPISYGAGQLAGGIAASAPLAGAGAASLGGRVLQAAGTGVIEGGLYNPGDKEGELSGLQLEDRAKQAAVGGLIGGVGQVLGTGVSKVAEKFKEAPKALKNYAELKAFKQSGAMLKDFRKNLGNNRANEIGREMLDKGIVSAGDSFEDIALKSSTLKAEAGKELGDIYSTTLAGLNLDDPKLVATRINPKDIADKLRVEISDKLKGKPGASTVLDRVAKELDTLAENSDDLSLDKAVELKSAFDDMINYNKPIKDDTILADQFRRMRRALNNAIDTRVESIGKASSDPELIKRLQSAKKTYGNMAEVSGIAKDRVARENANRLFSLGDRISGVSGAVLGGVQSGNIEGAIKGGIAGLLVGKASRLGGNAISAKAIDTTAKILESNPNLLGKWAEPLTMAATKSPKAFASTVETFRRDPEFQTIIEQRKKALLKD